jgi:CubicO group peptidase (beta-lactamase class C family)
MPLAAVLAAVLVAVISAALAIRPAHAQPAPYPRTRAVVDSLMRATGAPGVAVVLARGDRVVLAEGFGVADVETRARMTPDLVTHVGSVTKPFTAALALTFVGERRLSLDAPLARTVSGLAAPVGALTLAQLLAQTGGLLDVPGGDGPTGDGALLAMARALRAEQVAMPAGTFSYSNVGLSLAGLAAQEAGGQPYAALLRARVLAPLGMATATVRQPEALARPFASGHVRGGDGALRVARPVEHDAAIAPAGYLYASARELARFAIALADDGKVDGRAALPPAVVRAMLTPRVDVPGMSRGLQYGYGIFLDRFAGRSAWHAGTNRGHAAIVRVLPDARASVVVVCNLDGVRLDAIAEAALLELLGAEAARVATDARARAAPLSPRRWRPARDAELRAIEGRYENRLRVELRRAAGALELTGVGPPRRVTPIGTAADGRVWLASRLPGAATVDTVVVTPPRAGGHPGTLQLFLWTLPRAPLGSPPAAP